MGGESRGRVVADEGVQESRSTRNPATLKKAGSKSNTGAGEIEIKKACQKVV